MEQKILNAQPLVIPTLVKAKMFKWAEIASGEVSGLGIVQFIKGVPTVTDVVLIKQKSSGALTELDMAAITEFMMEYSAKGEDPSDIKLWWHSHANMQVFWSATDDKAAELVSADGWMYSVVINKQGEMLCRLDVGKPLRVYINNIPITSGPCSVTEIDKTLENLSTLFKSRVTKLMEDRKELEGLDEEALKKEFADKVTQPTYYQHNTTKRYGLYSDDEGWEHYGSMWGGGRRGVWDSKLGKMVYDDDDPKPAKKSRGDRTGAIDTKLSEQLIAEADSLDDAYDLYKNDLVSLQDYAGLVRRIKSKENSGKGVE